MPVGEVALEGAIFFSFMFEFPLVPPLLRINPLSAADVLSYTSYSFFSKGIRHLEDTNNNLGL